MNIFIRVCVLLSLCSVAVAEGPGLPAVTGALGDIASRFTEFQTILEPDKNEPEWWAGAPSVVRDHSGVFWLACRMRTAEGDRGLRGYELRLLRSEDGVEFEKVLSIRREDVPIPGFERPALLEDAKTGTFKLYACGPWQGGAWSIIKFADAPRPDAFDAASAYPVIVPPEKGYERDIAPLGYKDPVVLYANGAYHCYVIGYVRQNERIFHFRSEDGEQWTPVEHPYDAIMPLSGWHDFFCSSRKCAPAGDRLSVRL